MAEIQDAPRASLVSGLLHTVSNIAERAIEAPAFSDLSLMADQLSKMLLSTLSLSGAFKEDAVAAVYRDRSKTPFQRLIGVGTMFMQAIVKDPKFHAEFGGLLDEELKKLHSLLSEYFDHEKVKMP